MPYSFNSLRRRASRLPRFSLKTFLLTCVFIGVTTGWISRNYHEYQTEQNLIAKLIERLPKNQYLTATTNGVQTLSAGSVFS